jgi:hypothetical protein
MPLIIFVSCATLVPDVRWLEAISTIAFKGSEVHAFGVRVIEKQQTEV